MEDQCLRCNNRVASGAICRRELQDSAIVTTCSHVLCKDCAESTGFSNTDTKKRQCPVCTQPLPNLDDAAVMSLRPTEEYKMSVLCGFDPTTIMECASSALSFWNYQMLQETAYQKHLLLALSKKYSVLNDSVNKIIDEANKEIGSLHTKIEEMYDDNAKLQQKNSELSQNCRERGQKYAQLRKGYEALKKLTQHNQQNSVNEVVAQQAVNSFAGNPQPGFLNGASMKEQGINHTVLNQPVNLEHLAARNGDPLVEPLHRHERAGSGSQYSGEASRMPPPQKPFNIHKISPMNMLSQHRTPLPGAFRQAVDRPHSSMNINRVHDHHGFALPNTSHRYSTRNHVPVGGGGGGGGGGMGQHGRPISANGYRGGISSGMKVGGASTDAQIRERSGYVPLHRLNHRHSNSVPGAAAGPNF